MSTFKAFLILLVLTSLFLDESEAFIFRRLKDRVVNAARRVSSAIEEAVRSVCQAACSKLCPVEITGTGCHIRCIKLCKRSIPDFVMSDVQYRVQPMSKDFSHYDLNGDKLISPEEFSRAESVPLVEVYDIFKFADADGDNMLDMDEFETAPFVFTNEMALKINGMIENKDRKDQTTPKLVQDFFNITNQSSPSNNTWDIASVV